MEGLLMDAMYKVPDLARTDQQVAVLLDEEAVISGRGAQLMMVDEAEKIWAREEREEEVSEIAAEVRF